MNIPKLPDFSSFFIILIGDTHGYIDDFNIQKKVILKAKPEYVLCEQLENKKLINSKDFIKILNQEIISEMTEVKEIEHLVRLCKSSNIPMIGIDFKNFGIRYPKQFKEKLNSNGKFTAKEKENMDIIQKERELKQLEMIKTYAQKGRIVAITGAYHLRNNSPLIKGLNKFLAIYPEYNNRLTFGPVANKEKLSYGILRKNE